VSIQAASRLAQNEPRLTLPISDLRGNTKRELATGSSINLSLSEHRKGEL